MEDSNKNGLNPSEIESIVEKVIEEIDKSMLLGAAYDCMSEDGKSRFREKLTKAIRGI